MGASLWSDSSGGDGSLGQERRWLAGGMKPKNAGQGKKGPEGGRREEQTRQGNEEGKIGIQRGLARWGVTESQHRWRN
jgi:hypothetical protein